MIKKVLNKIITFRQAEAVKEYTAIFLYYSGFARLINFFLKPGASVLVYHSISTNGVFSDNQVYPELFENQIEYLKKKHTVVPFRRLIENLIYGIRIPDDWVVLTFDDGYLDNLTIATPILEKYGLSGTFYITVDVAKNNRTFFYDDIQTVIDNAGVKEVEVKVNKWNYRFRLDSSNNRNEAALQLTMALRDKSEDCRREFINYLREICKPGDEYKPAEKLYMDMEGVKKLLSQGMEIGSHTIRHLSLSGLNDAELEFEISKSKSIIENITGTNLFSISYPFGKSNTFDENVKNVARASGYEAAVTTRFGKVNLNSDIFALPRIGVRNTSLTRLKVNLMGLPI